MDVLIYQPAMLQTPNKLHRLKHPAAVPSVADDSPQVQKSEAEHYPKLNSKFLAKLKQVPDAARSYYIGVIYELYRLAQHDPAKQDILKKLVQHQEQTLDMVQLCLGNERFSQYLDWSAVGQSKFWKQANKSYLVLLICASGMSDRRFATFLYSEADGKAIFKPLKLTKFERKSDGTLQQVDSVMTFGRSFPNASQWFDPVSQELRIWNRLGGGSDPCGTQGTYRLQNDEFVLQEFTARWECDPRKKGDYERLYP
ncbi:hypothetical protein K9N68_11505 [Kovacikia minuta CCNUW1]|uniref:hypothetical protein n=1 Tax=Kovacikia minuta TaxID=2931930 RepID=UPI001CC9EC66|nr:hypothetical protein [Kovacikia minuta]UBF28436.1 hypothetical protein K9N68_11505 [Kovacikia minuta CCNUW1]